jgi:uncharacterized protein (DUF58 family)
VKGGLSAVRARLAPRLVRVRAGAARVRELCPLRLPGLALLAAALWVALRFSREEADYLLYPAGLAAAGLVVLCVASVVLGGVVLRRAVVARPAGVPETLETTVATTTTFRCPRFARWPLLEVDLDWAAPADVGVVAEPRGRELEEVVTARARGRHARVERRFTVYDVFGLAAVTFRVAWEAPFRVAPAAAAATAELAASYAHGDAFSSPSGRPEGDLVEMRRYGYGDPLRHVLWRTFARTRRLLVRMPERATAPQPITVAFLVAGDADEATAAAARLYLERGVLGPDFVFAAAGALRPTRDPRDAIEQIIDSAAARAEGGAALERLAAQVEGSRLASCLVFVPPVDGAWRERVVAFSRRLAAPATVIIGVDGEPAAPRRRWARWLLSDDPDTDAGAADGRVFARVPGLRAALESDGLRVQVLHRRTGLVA